jgi:hypothetical protein
MLTEEMKKKGEQSRRDGYIAFSTSGKPLTLDKLILFVQDIFPNHGLHQLAINYADNDQFVVVAQLGISTTPN